MVGAELPFEATWTPVTGERSPGEPVAIRIFAEPLAPRDAETRYGVTGVERPHLAFADPVACQALKEDDEVTWEGASYVVRAVRRFAFADVATLEFVMAGRPRRRG